jgi:hypothetical protein
MVFKEIRIKKEKNKINLCVYTPHPAAVAAAVES